MGELLKRAGAPVGRDLSGKAVATYVRATAKDGYQVVFSLAELDPGFTSNDIIVADTIDGKPLFDYQGPLRIVAPHDKQGRDRFACCSGSRSSASSSSDEHRQVALRRVRVAGEPRARRRAERSLDAVFLEPAEESSQRARDARSQIDDVLTVRLKPGTADAGRHSADDGRAEAGRRP